ncbi:MAG: type II toxin-antitoxin system Phd/YefM family antitoxin [Dehalococcoidia bacterium]|nr:type II toxin-antitoxin system Phd/YefM family antitoxin [Dehalococcoidia bacterium]
MKSYTTSEARERFAAILEQARKEGAVRIRRRDGQSFVLMPEPWQGSPLDVEGVTPSQPVTRESILQAVHEGRRPYD